MLKKVIVPTLVISGAVFAAFMLLLATKGSEQVEVQLDNKQVFYGDLKDVVTPGVGAALSLGIGVTGALIVGWGQSKRKTLELENRLSNLQNRLAQQNSEIEALKVSPANPALSQLRWFLEDFNSTVEDDDYISNTTMKYEMEASRYTRENYTVAKVGEEESDREQTSWKQMPTAEIAPILITGQESDSQTKNTRKYGVQSASTMFPSTQSVIGLNHQNRN
jgi:uncharacterized membrane-anchored protein YhcB (DUF1043 family)